MRPPSGAERRIPCISVIIAAYNAEDTIAEALRSAQRQTETDIEILVTDDASTDRTAETVGDYARDDRRIRLLRLPSNAGPGAARNAAIAAARGTWIAPLDCDDRYRPERLARLRDLAEARDAEMVADNLRLCGESGSPDGEPMFPPSLMEESGTLGAARFVEGNIALPGRRRGYGFLKPMIRRTFLEAHGLRYPEARFAEDYLFYLDCLLAGARWVVVPDALYEYVVGRGTLTQGHSADDLHRIIAAEDALLASPRVAADGALANALLRHRRSVALALAWFTFAESVKRREIATAAASLFGSRDAPGHIAREIIRALPRAMGRLSHRA